MSRWLEMKKGYCARVMLAPSYKRWKEPGEMTLGTRGAEHGSHSLDVLDKP